ncbi:MAG: hypothetical protein IJ275_05965 [Ruminococcus sp.]|nr:hypothetical protein [Ruminococcus sp.]
MKRFLHKVLSIMLTVVVVVSMAVFTTPVAYADTTSLPDFVDNSESPYFPAIENQGSLGACVYWAETYYQFTYTMNKAMQVVTTPENTFSPSWTFNFGNGGKNGGGWDIDGFTLMQELGNVPLSTVPYTVDDYLSWHPQESIWREALNYRVKSYEYFDDVGDKIETQITSVDDSDLTKIKTCLANGEVLSFTTSLDAVTVIRLKEHSQVLENSKYVNEYVIKDRIGGGEAHRMTIVGYNDKIWSDLNDNGQVDSGEMGAFKVANSWGTERHNKGFYWFSYDSLNRYTSVAGSSSTDRYSAVWDVARIEVRPYGEGSDLYIRYTLNTCDRGQSKMYITATKGDESYTYEVGPKRKFGMNGSNFSYDGTTNSNHGTMLYALDNVVPDVTPDNVHEYKWSIKFEDTNADSKVFTVKNCEIVDEKNNRVIKPANVFPFSLDGSSKTVLYPEIEEIKGIIGDSDGDTRVTIVDATTIQKYLAKIITQNEFEYALADCDKDGLVTISDATLIQRYLAHIEDDNSFVGK